MLLKKTRRHEVKPYKEARACIREALGQLLEYWYYRKSDKYPFAAKLIIVGPETSLCSDKTYLRKINEKHSIPIEYRQWDLRLHKLY